VTELVVFDFRSHELVRVSIESDVRLFTNDWCLINFSVRGPATVRAMGSRSTLNTDLHEVPSTGVKLIVFTVSDKELLLGSHTHTSCDERVTNIAA